MLTLGVIATNTVESRMIAITGIGIILAPTLDSVHYSQRSMGLKRVLKTSILVSKDATKQLKLLQLKHQQKEEERKYSKCRLL